MKKIIIEKSRVHGTDHGEYRAYLEEDSIIFCYGDTGRDAALKLIESYPDVFQIQIDNRT